MAPPTEDNVEQENNDDLSEEQHSKLVQYQEVTGIESLEAAKENLIKYNWNIELAVHANFNESEGIPSPHYNEDQHYDNNIGASGLTHEPLNSSIARTGINVLANHRRMSWTEWLIGLVLVPYRFTYNTIRDFITYIVRMVWPSFGRGSGDPVQDVLNFKANFETHFGLEHPTFYQGTYSQALSDAKKELRFLLLYLHSESHQDTPNFCSNVLCNPGFKEYVNGNMLFWACDVNTYEGYRVSKAVRESTYPFLAVICLRENRMTIVWRIEGFMPVDQLIALLARIINENEPALIAARAEKEERSMSQTIREEQDRDYELALEQDREKARRKRAIEEAKRKEENEKRDREMEKQRQLENVAERKAACRQRLEEIPEPDSSDPDVVQIRVKLPDGTVSCRKFKTSENFELLVDFVFGQENTPKEFALNSNFPRKTFQVDTNLNSTLAEIGITSSTVLFVQNLVEDSSDED